MKKTILLLLVTLSLNAKIITPNDVYAESMLIQSHLHFLLKHYEVQHNHEEISKRTTLSINLKPRNAWQKSYEILVKINMLRAQHNLPRIEPIGMEPVEKLNPDMVYEMTQRILAEIKIFEIRNDINPPLFKVKKYRNKTPLDVYNSFGHISATFDELNHAELSPSYVFAETMRIYDDLTLIIKHLNIKDKTVPSQRLLKATPKDSLKISMKVLEKIKVLQRSVGIDTIDMSAFNKKDVLPSDVYSITGVILSELQPIKAYIGLKDKVTTPALEYNKKVPSDIEQLMQWNFRKLSLIHKLQRK